MKLNTASSRSNESRKVSPSRVIQAAQGITLGVSLALSGGNGAVAQNPEVTEVAIAAVAQGNKTTPILTDKRRDTLIGSRAIAQKANIKKIEVGIKDGHYKQINGESIPVAKILIQKDGAMQIDLSGLMILESRTEPGALKRNQREIVQDIIRMYLDQYPAYQDNVYIYYPHQYREELAGLFDDIQITKSGKNLEARVQGVEGGPQVPNFIIVSPTNIISDAALQKEITGTNVAYGLLGTALGVGVGFGFGQLRRRQDSKKGKGTNQPGFSNSPKVDPLDDTSDIPTLYTIPHEDPKPRKTVPTHHIHSERIEWGVMGKKTKELLKEIERVFHEPPGGDKQTSLNRGINMTFSTLSPQHQETILSDIITNMTQEGRLHFITELDQIAGETFLSNLPQKRALYDTLYNAIRGEEIIQNILPALVQKNSTEKVLDLGDVETNEVDRVTESEMSQHLREELSSQTEDNEGYIICDALTMNTKIHERLWDMWSRFDTDTGSIVFGGHNKETKNDTDSSIHIDTVSLNDDLDRTLIGVGKNEDVIHIYYMYRSGYISRYTVSVKENTEDEKKYTVEYGIIAENEDNQGKAYVHKIQKIEFPNIKPGETL